MMLKKNLILFSILSFAFSIANASVVRIYNETNEVINFDLSSNENVDNKSNSGNIPPIQNDDYFNIEQTIQSTGFGASVFSFWATSIRSPENLLGSINIGVHGSSGFDGLNSYSDATALCINMFPWQTGYIMQCATDAHYYPYINKTVNGQNYYLQAEIVDGSTNIYISYTQPHNNN